MDELLTAEWVATVGAPLVVAVVSLFLSVRAVGRQLHHDRELARAAHRAETSRELGWELRAIADEVDAMDSGDSRWCSDWEGWRTGLDAVKRASVTLGDLSPLVAVLREINWRWDGAVAAHRYDGVSAGVHGWVLGDLVFPQLRALRVACNTLINWDGIGDPPIPTQLSEMPLPTRRLEHREWGRKVVAEYRQLVRDAEAKGYPISVPRKDVSTWLSDR